MRNFQKQFEITINNYIDEVRKKSNSKKVVLIYGAGDLAYKLYKKLGQESVHIDGFVVTCSENNPDTLLGKPVYNINKISFEPVNTLIILGVSHVFNEEIASILNKKGYDDYILSLFEFTYYLDEEKMYERPQIEITTRIGCSINCKFCPQQLLTKKYFSDYDNSVLTYENFVSCLNKTPDNTLVIFAGFSEPFLNRDTIRMIEYAAVSNREMSLYTTLVGVDENIMESLLKFDFYHLNIHFPDKKKYANIPVTDDYLRIVRMAVEHRKSDGSPFVDRGSAQSELDPGILDLVGQKIKINYDLQDRAGTLEGEPLKKRNGIKGELYCELKPPLERFVLLPNGDLVLCCQDFGLKHIVGNLLDQTWEEIVNGEKLEYIKKCLDDEKNGYVLCRDCIFGRNVFAD